MTRRESRTAVPDQVDASASDEADVAVLISGAIFGRQWRSDVRCGRRSGRWLFREQRRIGEVRLCTPIPLHSAPHRRSFWDAKARESVALWEERSSRDGGDAKEWAGEKPTAHFWRQGCRWTA